MIVRFSLYSVLKNLRFFEPFFLIYLLTQLELSYLKIGTLIGFQKLVTGLLEIPLGVATDRWGRRRALAACFGCYVVAFPIYALAPHGAWPLAMLYAGQFVFGVGEALRTGSHKAIMLDWADHTGRADEATRIVGVARFWSKTAAGFSALVGGLFLWWTGGFAGLFWGAAVAAAAGVALMLSYPRWLDGEIASGRTGLTRAPWREQFRRLWATPGLLLLMTQSVLLESQVKLVQHYLQPYFLEGFRATQLTVVGGVGAAVIGGYYLIHDGLGGAAAMAAAPLEEKLGGGGRALQIILLAAAAAAGAVAACQFGGWMAPGAVAFVLLAAMQNARRPIFIAQLNRVMDKPQRATTLSIESQGRNLVYAALAPLSGWLVDTTHELGWVFVGAAALLAAGLLLRLLFSAPRVDPPGTRC